MKDHEEVRRLQRELTLAIWDENSNKKPGELTAFIDAMDRRLAASKALRYLADNWNDTTVPQ